MRHLLDASWLVIDLETTSADAATARVVELAAARVERGALRWAHARLVNPGIAIPETASAVHGITDEMVASAPQIAELAERFLEQVRSAEVVVGYNAPGFDFPILSRLWGAAWDEAVAGKPVIDPLVVVRLPQHGRFWKGPGRHRLASVAERFGIEVARAHRAQADCETTALVLLHLIQSDPELFSEDVTALAAWLAEQGAQQRAELDAYHSGRRR
jgi:DNA polymerase-3 subunit epsilon